MTYVQTIAIRLLGDLGQLDIDDLPISALGSRKARALIWLLALGRGAFVPADVIVDSLWPLDPPARPADQVAVLVSRLRAVLGRDRIEHGDGGYRLRYDWLDVDEVEALTAETERRRSAGNRAGAAAAARVAVSLLRASPSGPGLAGSWATSQLNSVERLVERARRSAADAFLEAGSWLEAADAAAESISRDPYDEHALRTAMRANVAAGRPATALAIFATARERLIEELGADPSTETQELHTAILRGDSARSASVPLATAPGPMLVGRTPELAELDAAAERVLESMVQVILIEGEAGIGKTSLIRHWATGRTATDVVLFGSCSELGRSASLDPLLHVLGEHLRAGDDARRRDVLGPEWPLLAPLLGLAPASSLPPMLSDGVMGPTLLYLALTAAVARLPSSGIVILVLDDAHRIGSALADWLRFVRDRRVPLLVVGTVRTPEQAPIEGHHVLRLGPLDAEQTRELVGAERATELFIRSAGHPLFLTELALSRTDDGLPASLVEAVSRRCDALGPAGDTLRSAAVVSGRLDPDLLAAVLNRPALEILDDAELGVRHQLLRDDNGVFHFRHALVRDALSATAGVGRAAWLHRQVARVLARRPDADPVEVADHARRGGDLELAAASLRGAAARAAERFDHATAESLLDDALSLHDDPVAWLDRARVRTRRGRYAAAYEDVEMARPMGASALEVGAWASYFDRRFDQAIAFAADGATIAEDDAMRARCLTVAGRTHHAAGDLATAERLLLSGAAGSAGSDRLMASAWLGVLRSHQSRPAEALALLRPATRPELSVEHTSAILHALLFTGHAHALSGHPAAALAAFSRYSDEVERRDVSRFQGRGKNFAGWVLRNIGAAAEGETYHQEALAIAANQEGPETRVAALEDCAEARLNVGDIGAAAALLEQARAALHGDMVFGWRLGFKLELLQARLALALDDPRSALDSSRALALRAGNLGVPRYAGVAGLVAHRAMAALGEPVDLDVVEANLAVVESSVELEAWWWIGEAAATHRVPRWVDRAARAAVSLSSRAGHRGDALLIAAAPILERWRISADQ